MTGYLLDTNVISDLVRDPAGPAARRLAEVGQDAVATSIVVAAELRYGVARRGSPRLAERVEAALAALEVLPLAPPSDRDYGAIRASLEAAGTPIGGNDLLVAAQARAAGRIVVTANLSEFRRVPGLAVEDWTDGAAAP